MPSVFIRDADLFFLSSIDDPLPLACLEAMALGKRCVVYRKTGISEMLSGIRGCAVYDEYSIDAAMAALQHAFAEEPDSTSLGRLIGEKASVSAFVGKIDTIVFSK